MRWRESARASLGRAKDIVIKVIPSRVANNFIRRVHYSGKIVPNSRLHFGAFLDGVLHGALSFGASLDKRKVIGLVKNTGWYEFTELNRMAFDDKLPRNSESRCIAICLRMLKKQAPQIKWVLSYADACQCGDGAIYRASGFVLTMIKKNHALFQFPEPNGLTTTIIHEMNFKAGAKHFKEDFYKSTKGSASVKKFMEEAGAVALPGFQLRYIYFLDKSKLKDLTVPIIPFSEIQKRGVGMYKGEKTSLGSIDVDAPTHQLEQGGSIPTPGLQKTKT